jgi:hypothetical protein
MVLGGESYKIKRRAMHVLDYDEFNIYTNELDVENYIQSLIEEGIELKNELYDKCLTHFGKDLMGIIDSLFDTE